MSGTHTPGPWRWELNKASKSVALLGGRPKFDKSVMCFERYGMSHAAPSFNNARLGEEGNLYNEMERCDKYGAIVQGREHHKDWFQEINHPDALLIAAAPDMYEVLTAIEAVILGGNQSDFELMFCVSSPIREALYSAIAKATGSQA